MITGTNILADLGHVAQSASDGDDLFGRLGDDSHFRVVDDHVTPDAHRWNCLIVPANDQLQQTIG